MKKWGIAFLFAATMVTLPVSSSFAASTSDHSDYGSSTLQYGSKGSQVAKLQEDLRTLGYFTYPRDTGFYGPITTNAVRHFQAEHGLSVNGKVGMTTGPLITSNIARKQKNTVVTVGNKYVGVPYVWGGTSPSGFDCSGYVQYVFKRTGISLPRTVSQMYSEGYSVNRESLREGDLVFFTTYASGASHVGIYVGNGQFLTASSSRGVIYASLSNPYWGPRYIGAKRVL